MDEVKDWLWLVQTDKGDFFITVLGNWTQEEAAKKIRRVFDEIKLDITAMIPSRRSQRTRGALTSWPVRNFGRPVAGESNTRPSGYA
jgi:hypothetical protein